MHYGDALTTKHSTRDKVDCNDCNGQACLHCTHYTDPIADRWSHQYLCLEALGWLDAPFSSKIIDLDCHDREWRSQNNSSSSMYRTFSYTTTPSREIGPNVNFGDNPCTASALPISTCSQGTIILRECFQIRHWQRHPKSKLCNLMQSVTHQSKQGHARELGRSRKVRGPLRIVAANT